MLILRDGLHQNQEHPLVLRWAISKCRPGGYESPALPLSYSAIYIIKEPDVGIEPTSERYEGPVLPLN